MKPEGDNAFARHVYAVQRYVSLTAPRYECLCRPGLVTHPICCFGNPANARIVTVGLNPSDGEFAPARHWPTEPMLHTKLADRCRSYFASPHGWFAPWVEGLEHLGVSYQEGSAVHIDLSPRATRPVSEFRTDATRKLFLEMVERDGWVFFGTLELCRKAEVLLIAGTVTGEYYINEFLGKHAPNHGHMLEGRFVRSKHPGRGKTARHTLSGPGRNLRVFFCSSSPSDRDTTLLPDRIAANFTHAEYA